MTKWRPMMIRRHPSSFSEPPAAALLCSLVLLGAASGVWAAAVEGADVDAVSFAAPAAGDTTPSRANPDRSQPARSQRGVRPVPDAEWDEVSEFMGTYMPWRIAAVRQMSDGPPKERLKRLLASRRRGLRLLQRRDREAYEQRLEQLRVEDKVYKIVSEWGAADAARRQKIRDDLTAEVARLVDLDLQERRRRVERLEEQLQRQKEALERDTAERNRIISRRVGAFMDWGIRWPAVRPDGPADRAGRKPSDADSTSDAAKPVKTPPDNLKD